MEEEIPLSERLDRTRRAIETDDVPKIYANGFVFVQSSADVGLILEQSNGPVAVIYMSHILAKTLVKKLGASLLQFEETLGQDFLTTDDLNAGLKKTTTENK